MKKTYIATCVKSRYSPHVAYIVLTFELVRFARVIIKVNTICAMRGESGNEAKI